MGVCLGLSLSLSLSARFWFLRAVCAEPVSQQERQQTTIIWLGAQWGELGLGLGWVSSAALYSTDLCSYGCVVWRQEAKSGNKWF